MQKFFPKSHYLGSCVVFLLGAQSALSSGMPAIVGEAAMVIGMAHVTTAGGVVSQISRGSAIHEGDRIETESGGHVHVRFVDGGRLSVRPLSRLQVENYNHSIAQPSLTAIKFRLDEGVVRSITGTWGQAAREKFRLNTPVAAIGIKGTDFVVRSDVDTTAASVYSGAIVLSALSAGCQSSLGPCSNEGEKLLSQDMKGQMLELGRGQSSPKLVPLVDLLALNVRGNVAKSSTEKQASPETAQRPNNDKSPGTVALPPNGVTVSSNTPTVKTDLATSPVLPTLPVADIAPPSVNQLVWGRYAWANSVEGDAISKSFELARDNGRTVTIGNGAFSLYREGSSSGPDVLATAEATASFRLAGSSAQLMNNQGVSELAAVDSGSLNLDFTRRTFATQLAVSNVTLGVSQIEAAGSVSQNGVFLSQTGNAGVAGALSFDAKEAGYLFEKTTANGALRGITLWGR